MRRATLISRAIRLGLTLSLLATLTTGAAGASAPSSSPQAGATTGPLTGLVLDASGAPIAGATIRVVAQGATVAETETGPDGRFVLDAASESLAIEAEAPGFARGSLRVGADRSPTIVLQPAGLTDSITVTASRGVSRLETPNSTTIVTSAALLNTGAATLDDALRTTPGFSLFRRSSSRVANPTTQGVTLRGLSGSGASRTLVLADGLPLNDPFGSWVYWNKVPQAAVDRVEVLRGATGDLYGADALGGVIQVLTFSPGRARLRATLEGGSHDTGRVSLFGGGQRHGWNGSVAGEWVATDGVVTVARDERGPVDVRADSDYRTGFVTAGYDAGAWRASVRGSGYAEDRGNGTPLQVNSTDWRQVSGQVAGTAGGGAWLARAAGGSQSYYQTFSAVAAGRRTERLTTEQNTPSDFSRVSGQWIQSLGAHTLLVGGEHQQTSSTARSVTILTSGVRLAPALTGGAERSTALFARASLAATSDLSIAVGLRGDFWKSDPDDASQPVKDASFASPRASLTWRADETLALQASAYRAYRTPTLNELHRGFRVGNVVTNPNPLLEPERLTGIEGGVLVSGTRSSARATAFWNVLDDAIANITVATTPALITRERQNADRVRAAGIELEADVRPTASLTLNALAAFTASTFNKTPKQPAIEGNRVPQVPRYQLGLGATFTNPRLLTASAQLRVVGVQFDDDQNAFELEAFAVLDASVSRMLTRGTHLFVAVENLFDAEYDVGRTPVRTVGWPRTVRAGLRLFLP